MGQYMRISNWPSRVRPPATGDFTENCFRITNPSLFSQQHPPSRAMAKQKGWAGHCTSTTQGNYTLLCSQHIWESQTKRGPIIAAWIRLMTPHSFAQQVCRGWSIILNRRRVYMDSLECVNRDSHLWIFSSLSSSVASSELSVVMPPQPNFFHRRFIRTFRFRLITLIRLLPRYHYLWLSSTAAPKHFLIFCVAGRLLAHSRKTGFQRIDHLDARYHHTTTWAQHKTKSTSG